MEIELTNEQYYNLTKLLTIAEWVIGVIAEDIDEDGIFEDEIEPMLETQQYILSKHKDFGLDKVFKDENDSYFVNYEIEGEILPLIELYEENIFWESLIDRLARRDMIEEYGEKAVDSMDPLQIAEIEDTYIGKYQEEFSQNEISRLKIKFN